MVGTLEVERSDWSFVSRTDFMLSGIGFKVRFNGPQHTSSTLGNKKSDQEQGASNQKRDSGHNQIVYWPNA
jgi:hypothetical protein